MPKQTNFFQTLVYQVQEHHKEDQNVTVTESKNLINKASGNAREVDIVVEMKFGDLSFTMCFECTAEEETPGSPWVEEMIGKHKYLPTDKLVLVSKNGFAQPAYDIAKAENIDLLSLDEASNLEWDSYNWASCLNKVGWFHSEPLKVEIYGPEGSKPLEGLEGVDLRRNSEILNKSNGSRENIVTVAGILLNNTSIQDEVSRIWFFEAKPPNSAGLNFELNWQSQPKTHYLCIGEEEYEIHRMVFHMHCRATEIPVELTHAKLHNTLIAYSEIKNLLPFQDSVLGDKSILLVSKSPDGEISSSLAFVNSKDPKRKIVNTPPVKGRAKGSKENKT